MFEIVHHSHPDNNPANSVSTTIYHPNLVESGKGLIEASLSVELNSAGTLEIQVPINHPDYGIFDLRVGECSVKLYDREIWRGFVSEEGVDFDGTKTIVCTGIQAYLNDSVVKVGKGTYTPRQLLTTLIANHNRQMTENKSHWARPLDNKQFVLDSVDESLNEKTVSFDDNDSYDITWNVIETSLIEELGGYIKVWRDGNVNKISYTEKPGSEDTTNAQVIEYGKNLLDLNFSITTEDFFTVIVPTAQSVSGNGMLELDPIINEENADKFGYIWQTFSLSRNDASSDSALRTMLGEAASEKLEKAGALTSIEGKALDWHHIDVAVEAITLGDKNLIVSYPNGFREGEAFVCNRIDYDLLYFEQSEYAFGDVEKTLTSDQIYELNKVADDVARRAEEEDAINQQLSQILTNTLFYISFSLDSEDKMTCRRTVQELADAKNDDRAITMIEQSSGTLYDASISLSLSNDTYTVTISIPRVGKRWRGTNLSASDILELPLDNS